MLPLKAMLPNFSVSPAVRGDNFFCKIPENTITRQLPVSYSLQAHDHLDPFLEEIKRAALISKTTFSPSFPKPITGLAHPDPELAASEKPLFMLPCLLCNVLNPKLHLAKASVQGTLLKQVSPWLT